MFPDLIWTEIFLYLIHIDFRSCFRLFQTCKHLNNLFKTNTLIHNDSIIIKCNIHLKTRSETIHVYPWTRICNIIYYISILFHSSPCKFDYHNSRIFIGDLLQQTIEIYYHGDYRELVFTLEIFKEQYHTNLFIQIENSFPTKRFYCYEAIYPLIKSLLN